MDQGIRAQIALWRARATEARAIAAEMPTIQASRIFEEMARAYQQMADGAEADLSDRSPEVGATLTPAPEK